MWPCWLCGFTWGAAHGSAPASSLYRAREQGHPINRPPTQPGQERHHSVVWPSLSIHVIMPRLNRQIVDGFRLIKATEGLGRANLVAYLLWNFLNRTTEAPVIQRKPVSRQGSPLFLATEEFDWPFPGMAALSILKSPTPCPLKSPFTWELSYAGQRRELCKDTAQ